jgi:ribulose-phosphate 3-epimerase
MVKRSISPSLICMDLCNLEQNVRELESVGCDMLHIDLLDGYFSPSMPIGIDVIKQLRKKTDLFFDCHLMTMDCTFFMEELVNAGVEQLCFQVETERHISKKLSYLKEHGVKPGVALSPSTSLSVLDYALEQCDFVLLMMINPGYASNEGEKKIVSLLQKIKDLKAMIDCKGLATTIELDGRVYPQDIEMYIDAGASTFVAGTSSLFHRKGSLKENYMQLQELIARGKEKVSSQNIIFT